MSVHPLETFLADCHAVRTTGANAPETSFYPALSTLFNEVGRHLKPKVRCVMGLKDQGAGMPDGGLFTESQFGTRRDQMPLPGQMPERGVIEVKPVGADLAKLAATEQVVRYWTRYRLVLVTDLREFALLGEEGGATVVRERYRLADTTPDFWELARHPHKAAAEQGERFEEFVRRVLLHAAPLVDPKDVAWFLASYARDARSRVEGAALPALDALRSALEQALGVKFEGEKGEHFFRSTLVQTLFYGVFASWVLWHRAGGKGRFDWHNAAWSLHVPMIRALFEQIAVPSKLRPLGLEEPLSLTAATLNRVARAEFFKRFDDRHAVQYFYEPFLEAFDPELRKQLGVWYTPEEIVRYMVRRVDQVLVSELGIADGLADPQVYVLDPCCGTGAYLVETLAVIGERLKAKGTDALAAQRLKRAMTERIFGFEILPAPFVVAHLQIGLLLTGLGAPLGEDERAGVYLTNALTGWEPPKGPKQHLIFPELEQERDAAESVKQEKPILVILGNPPYNAFAGVAQGEEQDLVEPYKRGLIKEWGIKKFNLDDLYVRFFRLAERRIAENSKRGIVCFISNHSWVSEPSLVVLRKHLLESFDTFWLENMHGNRRASEYAPDGKTSETIFAVPGFSPGIQQGIVISLWAKKGTAGQGAKIHYRDDLDDAKADDRRRSLVLSLTDPHSSEHYGVATPTKENRLSFRPQKASSEYLAWPRLTELCGHDPIYGLNENRRGAMISIDRERVVERVTAYLDPKVSNAEAAEICGGLMQPAAVFDPIKTRKRALAEHEFEEANIRRFTNGPFDNRWCYWSPVMPMWNRPRPDLFAQHWKGNRFLHVRRFGRRPEERIPVYFGTALPELHLMDPDVVSIPLRWHVSVMGIEQTNANLSDLSRNYLKQLGIPNPDLSADSAEMLWLHALAICYSDAWLTENGDAIRTGFPRVPLPVDSACLKSSSELGATIAALLDPDVPFPGASIQVSLPQQKIAVISRVGGGSLDPGKGDLALSAGWGHAGREGVIMSGKGRVESRATSDLPEALGARVHDIYLNQVAYWAHVPEKVWDFTIGGYQVMKKWLSYRERSMLGRDLTIDEAEYFTEMARRITAILLMSLTLDENYQACKAAAYQWPK